MVVSTDVKPVAVSLSNRVQTISAEDLPELLEHYQLMPKLIRDLIVDETISAIPCEADELDFVFQQICQHHQIADDEAAIQAWLQRQNTSMQQYRDWLSRSMRIQKYQEATWGSQLNAIFLERKHELDKITYSFLRTPDPFAAQELFFRLQTHEQSFDELAAEIAQEGETQPVTTVGPVLLGTLPSSLAQLLSTSQPGRLLSPIKINNRYCIYRVEQFYPARLDDKMRKTLLKQLFDDWLDKEVSRVTVRTEGGASGTVIELWK
ncbi:MAG: peptidylprolyl isomerase [Cyanobacteria bacterium P01_F01_bin.86]